MLVILQVLHKYTNLSPNVPPQSPKLEVMLRFVSMEWYNSNKNKDMSSISRKNANAHHTRETG
jgi:hypothetical protein